MLNYILQNDLNADIRYCLSALANLAFYREHDYEVSLPPPYTREDNISPRDTKRPEFIAEVCRAIVEDNSRVIDVAPYEKLVAAALPAIKAFIDAFALETPNDVDVYVTQYGPGGSYCALPSYAGPRGRTHIYTRPEKLKKLGMPFVANLVHETIHLIIEHPVINGCAIEHAWKEKIVDTICMCDELRTIMGDYRYQPHFWSVDIGEYVRAVPWKPGRVPTWTARADVPGLQPLL